MGIREVAAQDVEMERSPIGIFAIVVAITDCTIDDEQQHLRRSLLQSRVAKDCAEAQIA